MLLLVCPLETPLQQAHADSVDSDNLRRVSNIKGLSVGEVVAVQTKMTLVPDLSNASFWRGAQAVRA